MNTRRVVASAVCLVGSILLAPVRAHAQPAPSVATGERTVEGRVRRPIGSLGDSTGMGPAGGAWVTVHRVAKDSQGPIDSVRTDAQGRYRFRWTATGSADAVYFASVMWDGIAYFTSPLRSANSRGDEAEITVFDTTSKSFPLTVRGRHLIIGKPDSVNARTVVEVYELSNDSTRTLISVDGPAPAATWSASVPAAAIDVRATQGEVSPDAFAFNGGRVSVFAPMAPGVKQVSFSYKLPAESFPVAFTAERGATVFEVLVEELAASVVGNGFATVDPVTIEQRNFRRFLAQDVRDGVRVTVNTPAVPGRGRNLYIAGVLVVIGGAMLLVLLRSMQRGASARAVPLRADVLYAQHAEPSTPDRLAHEIAALDVMFSAQRAPTDVERAAYERRRDELKRALTAVLADAPAAG